VEKSEIQEILAKSKALNLQQGLVVRSSDGRAFFLTEEEIDRKALTPEVTAAIAAIFEKKATGGLRNREMLPGNEEYCAGITLWLLTHEPDNEHWRKVSVIWMNEC
jgi:hypothetical protein